jgi:hypothetical protein
MKPRQAATAFIVMAFACVCFFWGSTDMSERRRRLFGLAGAGGGSAQ